MAPRLAVAEIALEWNVFCQLDHVELEPREGLAILRIVQESIANVLKHARASRLTVTIEATATFLRVKIADDGVGFVPGAARGRGLPWEWHLLLRQHFSNAGHLAYIRSERHFSRFQGVLHSLGICNERDRRAARQSMSKPRPMFRRAKAREN